MRKSNIQQLTLAAMVAAVYFVLCYFGNIFQLTFGPVQVRLGEALTVLPFLFPAAAPGLALGCLLTNILSPYGPIDMIVGTLATAIAAFLSIKMPRWYLAALPPIVVNALLLPPMWAWAEAGAINGAFWAARLLIEYSAIFFSTSETVCMSKSASMMCGELHLGFLAFPLWYSLQ